jgi:PKD repeat protein
MHRTQRPAGAKDGPWAATTILIILLVSGAGGIATAPAGIEHAAPRPGDVSGAVQLALASASLADGRGPAALMVAGNAAGPTYHWTNVTDRVAPAPSDRFTSMAWDAADGYVVLYGGLSIRGNNYTIHSDTWTFVNGTWKNITATVSGSPPPLGDAAMAYDPPDQAVILFGGTLTIGGGSLLNATWTYHAGVWTNVSHLSPAAPSPRIVPGLTYDSTDQELVLCGGFYTNDTETPGTWVYRGTTWTNVTNASPLDPHLYLPMLADDPAGHGVLMSTMVGTSPEGGTPFQMETFLYSGGLWHNLTGSLAQEPPLLYVGQMVYVPAAAGDFLMSGAAINGSGYYAGTSVTWEFTGGAWSNVTASTGPQPPVGIGPAVTLDPVDDAVIAFGRASLPSQDTIDSTWVLSAAPTVNVTAATNHLDSGGVLVPTVSVGEGFGPLTYSWNFGDGGNSTVEVPSHPYTTPGVYAATLTVTDFLGETGTGTVPVVVAAFPSVTITAGPSTPSVGEPVGVVAVVVGGTAPFTYAWSFGAGITAQSAVVYHTYTTSGSYAVYLNVTDAAGSRIGALSTVMVSANSTAGLTSGSSGSSNVGDLEVAGLLGLAIVAAVVGFLVGRRGGGSPPPPHPASSPPAYPSVPSGAAAPPPAPPPG